MSKRGRRNPGTEFPESLKRKIRDRANGLCCLCGKMPVEIHHIIPVNDGGDNAETNAAPLCPTCHRIWGNNPDHRKMIAERRDAHYERCSSTDPAAIHAKLDSLAAALSRLERDDRTSSEVTRKGCGAVDNQWGGAADCCWLRSVTVDESPVFVRGSTLDLARITVVLGANASGKTALCEWLAGSGDISLLRRWSALSKPTGRTQVRFDAITPSPLTWTIQVFSESNIRFELDGQAVPQLNLAYGFVYASERPQWIPEETTSSYLARWLHIDTAHLHNVVRSLNVRGALVCTILDSRL